MSASYPTKIVLAMNSGNRCALQNCRATLSSPGKLDKTIAIGEAAHIYGEKKGAARYRDDMTDEQRNAYENLIYLCPTCHTKIDKQEADYPAESLLKTKHQHEEWVSQKLDDGMSSVTFVELEIAAKALASGTYCPENDFHVIPPQEKIEKNNLTIKVHKLISMGLSRSTEVSSYLQKQAQLDDQFPERLKEGFKTKYLELKASVSGDALFMAILEFAQQGKNDFTQNAASLAILCHLFQLCEVFEK